MAEETTPAAPLTETDTSGSDKAQAAAEKKAIAAGKAQIEAEQAEREATAKREEEAVKVAEDIKKGDVKTDKDGNVLGVDGENVVSNVNPDPRCIRGARL